MNDRIAQNHRKAALLALVGILIAIPLILTVSFGAARAITWQVTRQTHLERFHQLRMRRIEESPRIPKKRVERELAADLRTANAYTAAEKNMRMEILVACAAGLSAVLGLLLWLFCSSPASRLMALCGARPAGEEERAAECILETLSVAADTAIPSLYVIESPSPDAFAVGMTPDTAAVAVTTELLARLDRRELDWVLAHELSHIAAHDTRPNTIVALFAMLTGTHRLLSRLMVREDADFLADADAAHLTGDPDGLAHALSKIGDAGSAVSAFSFAGGRATAGERLQKLAALEPPAPQAPIALPASAVRPGLTIQQIAFCAGFTIVVFAGMFILLLQFGGR